MSKRTHHSYAVVTGAGSGIGRAFAVELAKRGGKIVCADLDEAPAKETVLLIEQQGGEERSRSPATCRSRTRCESCRQLRSNGSSGRRTW